MLTVKDSLYEYTIVNYPEINNKSVFLDIFVYSLIAYSYYFGNSELYTKFFKYLFAFLLLRYLFSVMTNYTINQDQIKNKVYYQLNSTIGIFVLIIFLGNFDLNFFTQIILVLIYAIFSSLINGYTTDNLLTVLVVYNLLQIPI
jgi:hypothetical protein